MEAVVLTEAYYYILLSLFKPLHGYGIMQKVEEMSHGRVTLAAGTLYGALSALSDRGWINQLAVAKDSRRKAYQITKDGRAVILNELDRLEELVTNGKEIIGGEDK